MLRSLGRDERVVAVMVVERDALLSVTQHLAVDEAIIEASFI